MSNGEQPCTPAAAVIFFVGLIAGTGCIIVRRPAPLRPSGARAAPLRAVLTRAPFTLCARAHAQCSKALFELEAEGLNGEMLPFKPAVFQTWVMFFGMLFALPMYLIMEAIRRHKAKTDAELKAQMNREPKVTVGMLLKLGVPAIFDLCSVLLMVAGLMHISASMWMLLRGGGIVFVAMMKQFALGDRLSKNMWWGVSIISMAVALVGLSSTLNGGTGKHPTWEIRGSIVRTAY